MRKGRLAQGGGQPLAATSPTASRLDRPHCSPTSTPLLWESVGTHWRRSCRPSFHMNWLLSRESGSAGPLETRGEEAKEGCGQTFKRPPGRAGILVATERR